MDLLKRKLAPISDEAWSQIDDEARRVLKLNLAGRKLVDFSGPHGWQLAGVNTGRLRHIQDAPVEHVGHAIREVRPLLELRAQIVLDTLELDYAARGATDLDLDPVVNAAEHLARAEDRAIFHGFKPGGITGIIEASPHKPIVVQSSREWPRAISAAKEVLRRAAIDGPYALALGRAAYDELTSEEEGGFPLRYRIEEAMTDGSLIWAPSLDNGAVLISTRGGDYELTVGQDLSIGYTAHDRTQVELYLTESFTFRVLENKAAIWLSFGGK
jgi:uncharacterized linocin/CFP29 family protein